MRPVLHISVEGATTHLIPLGQLESLQAMVAELGAVAYPLFLRLGGAQTSQLQPVTSRALLAEIEKFIDLLSTERVPGMIFQDASGAELGGILGGAGIPALTGKSTVALSPEPEGIRVVIKQVPPPVGFRSRRELPTGWYECYFRRFTRTAGGFSGERTEAMGGSGAPVELPELPLPPVTRWDFARVAGKPAIATVTHVALPIAQAYIDVLHGLTTACNDSIRLKKVLRARRD